MTKPIRPTVVFCPTAPITITAHQATAREPMAETAGTIGTMAGTMAATVGTMDGMAIIPTTIGMTTTIITPIAATMDIMDIMGTMADTMGDIINN